MFYYAGLSDEMIKNIDSIRFVIGRCGAVLIQWFWRRGRFFVLFTGKSKQQNATTTDANSTLLMRRHRIDRTSFSGMSPDGRLVEAIELPNHPLYVGLLAHPGLSLVRHAASCCLAFMKKAIEQKDIRCSVTK